MFRSVARVVIAALALSVIAHAYVVPATVTRQIVGDASDASGIFTKVDSQSFPICPNRILHKEIAAPLPHKQIAMNGKPCNDGGEMEIFTDLDAATAVAGEYAEVITTVNDLDSFASVIVGYEEAGRTCTGGGSSVSLPEKTLVLILRPSETVDVPGLTIMFPRFVYMVLYQPDGTRCSYTTPVTDVPSPAASPAASPASSTAASPTAASPTVEPTTAPSAPSNAAMTAAASPSPPDTTPEDAEEEATSTPDGSGDGTDGSGDGTDGSGDGTDGSGDGTDGSGDGTDGSGDGTDGSSGGTSGGDDSSGDTSGDDESDDSTPEPTPAGSEDDGPVCFPADAEVELEDGSSKKMADVRVGDRVLVASGEYSDIYMFSHKVANVKNSFVTLRTASGLEISATSGHYLYINGQLAAARMAKIGDEMSRGDGVSEPISAVTIETKTGLYNPQTTHGDIIVNGVRASTFTTTVKHCTAQALLAPIRLAYNTLGLSLNAFDNGADKIASVMPKGQPVA